MKLFHSAAKSRGVVGARARFRIGEIHFQKKAFLEAIRHYQRLMYGFGALQAADDIRPWQARAGYQAGMASWILAGEATSEKTKGQLIEEGKKYFHFALERHPEGEIAQQAAERLKKL